MARPVTLFTGQWADLPLEDMARKASEFGYHGLELACWGDHFEVDKALSDDGLLRRPAAICWNGTTCKSSRSAITSSARRCSTRSTSGTRRSCRRTSGATATRPASTRRAAEEMKNTARAAQKLGVERGQRLHRFEHLAFALFVPAGAAEDDRRRLRAAGRAVESDPRRVRRVRREVRPGSPSDGNRLRHLHGRAGARGARTTARSSASTSIPSHLHLAGGRSGRVHPRVPRPHLSRPHEGRDRHAQRPERASWPAI